MLLGIAAASAASASPFELAYSGRVTRADGAPVEGKITATVHFYRAATGGDALPVTLPPMTDVPLSQGVFHLQFALAPDEFNTVFNGNDEAWIEVTVDDKVYPRQKYGAVPYALKVPIDGTTIGYNAAGQLTYLGSTGVTSVTATGPLAVGGSAGAPVVSLSQAGALSPGYLSATDWATFNGKQAPLGFTPVNKAGDTLGGALDMGGHALTNLVAPSAASDAATKAYADANLGGLPLDQTAKLDQYVVKWDNAAGKFVLGADQLGAAGGGIQTFNTLNTTAQTLAVGSAGTAPAWTSAGSTHTLNVPLASAAGVTAGLLAKTDYDTFSAKQPAITAASALATGSLSTALQGGLEVKPYGVAAGNTGELRFDELAASGANYVAFKAPDALSANVTYTLPGNAGASGAVLQSDGAGILSWGVIPAAPVASVAGKTGVVTLSTTDVSEGTGLYYTDARARGAVSGTAPIAYNAGTGAFSLANTAVSAGSYTRANITVDAQGRLTAASNGAAVNLATEATGTLPVANGGTGAASAAANLVFASPDGAAGAPAFRALTAADVPSLTASKISDFATAVAAAETDPQIGANTTSFVPKWNGTALVSGMIYDNGTSVGVGTSSPGNTFTVSTTTGLGLEVDRFTTAAASAPGIQISKSASATNGTHALNGTADAEIGKVIFAPSDGVATYRTTAGLFAYTGTGGHTAAADMPTYLTFKTTPDGSGTPQDRLRIEADGNVGIGTAGASAKLEVNGTLRLDGSTSGFVALKGAAAAGGTTFTLPSADGAAGEVLRTDGSGNLGWVAAATATPSFSTLSSGTNTAAAMTVGSGASIVASGTGVVEATKVKGSGSTTDAVDLATAEVAGTLAIGSGGTGATSFTNNGVLLGTGSLPLSATAAGTANQVLRVPGAGGAPAFGALDVSQGAAVTGTLALANGGTGANLSATGGAGQYLKQSSTGAVVTVAAIAAADLPAMAGDTGSGGTKGAVPAPGSGDAAAGKYLKADGTWTTVSVAASGVSGLTAGSVPYANGTGLTQDNANFFWDGTNHRLGIGTTAPNNSLQVVGSVFSQYTNDTVGFGSYYLGNAASARQWAIRQTTTGSDFALDRYLAGTGWLNALTILDASGNVGVGTTSPQKTLHVQSAGMPLRIERSSMNYLDVGFVATAVGSDAYDAYFQPGSGSSAGYLFNTHNGTIGVNALAIDKNGNIGIGTTSPTAKLQVTGGQAVGTIVTNDTGLTVDFSTGNMHIDSVAAGTLVLSNMLDGGAYNLILTNATGGNYTLSGSSVTTWKCNPACTSNQVQVTAGQHTVVTILKAGTTAYVSWVSGFQ